MYCIVFYLVFGYTTANFEPLSRGQPDSPDFNNYIFIEFSAEGHREPRSVYGKELCQKKVRFHVMEECAF